MGFLIGIDEAGLGPNLGPYVVTATVWEVPGSPTEVELWDQFSQVVTREPGVDDARLFLGDSKTVFQSGKGIHDLERGVLCTLGLLPGFELTDDLSLRRYLTVHSTTEPCRKPCCDPWYADSELRLPVEADQADLLRMTADWQMVMSRQGIRLVGIYSEIVEPGRFNELMDQYQNKAEALSFVSLNLLRQAVADRESEPVLVCCDKHGGRNRYAAYLVECFEGALVQTVRESAEQSVYRLDRMEIRFEPKSERYFPVAVASMISKYVREIAMLRFNRFWKNLIPEIRPTQGYPVDAKRFRAEIAQLQQELNIPDRQLWRSR